MMDNPINSNEAAKIFLEKVIRRAYDGVINDMQSLLSEGPTGRKPQKDLADRALWFQNLEEESRKHIEAIIQASVNAAVFGCLVVLDNMTIGGPLEEKLSDYALYLQTYADMHAHVADQPQESIRINVPNKTESLHDMFRWELEGRQT
jgi:hypothetical protein